jgi:O-antigen ligase
MAITLKRQVVLICMLLATAGLIKQFSLSQIATMGLAHCLFAIAVGIAVEQMLHTTRAQAGDEYRFAGTLHPNHMGINAAILLLCSLYIAHRRDDRRFLFIAAIAFVTLVMTKSRTALFSAAVGCVVFAFFAYRPRNLAALILTLLIAAGVAMAISSTDLFSSLGQTVLMNRSNSDPTTLTGRTMIWQFAYERVRDDWSRMFAGFGYGAFWTPDTDAALSQRAHFSLSEGHNAYLDVMLQLGLIGLGLYLIGILGALRAWIAAARRTGGADAAFAVGLLAFALNHHIAESAMTAPSFPTLILWCVIGSVALTGGMESMSGPGLSGGEV